MRRPSLLFMIPMAICTLVLVVALLPMSFAHLQPVHAAPTKLSNTSSTGRYHSMKTRHAVTFNTAALNLQYNGGPTMRTTSTNYLIFWEPATLQDGTPTYVSPTYNSLIEQYFNDSGGSSLYNNNTQYYDTTGHILNNSSIGGVWIDTSPYPPSGCNDSATPHGCLSGKQIVNEVKKAISTNNWTVDTTHMFFFFSSWGEGSCHGDCAFTNYCAYHATFTTSSNQAAIFANIPYTGTDLSACGVPQSPNGDFDADSSINITSHEHMEAVTDPLINAWFDPYGSEIGDKCDFNFGPLTLDGGLANAEWNNHYYVVQQEWSNALSRCTIARSVSGSVYVGSDDKSVYALNASDGSVLWSSQTGGSIFSSPALVNGVIYVGSEDDNLYALNASDGTVRWRAPTGGAIYSSPKVVSGTVYVGSNDGDLYSFKTTTGTQRWKAAIGSPVVSSPTVVGQVVYVGANDGKLYALNTADGSQLWSYPTSGPIDSQPKVVGGVVYVSSQDGSLYAINTTTHALNWSYATGSGIFHSSPTVVNGVVYVGSSNGNVYAISSSSGSLLWSYATGGEVFSSPTVVNKVLYVGSWDDYVYALNATTGAFLWKQVTGGQISSTPLVVDGMLFVGSNDGNVYAMWANDGGSLWQQHTGGAVESSLTGLLTSY